MDRFGQVAACDGPWVLASWGRYLRILEDIVYTLSVATNLNVIGFHKAFATQGFDQIFSSFPHNQKWANFWGIRPVELSIHYALSLY